MLMALRTPCMLMRFWMQLHGITDRKASDMDMCTGISCRDMYIDMWIDMC